MRRTSFALIAALLLLAACYAAWPLLSLLQIKHAAETGDTATLERAIDWPAVKESLTATLVAQMTAAPSQPETGAMGYLRRMGRKLNAMVAPGMIRGAVSRYATPAGVVELAEQRRVWSRRLGDPLPETFVDKMKDLLSRTRRISFVSLTRVEAEIEARGNPGQRIVAVVGLRGWRWMLSEVRVRTVPLPPKARGPASAATAVK